MPDTIETLPTIEDVGYVDEPIDPTLDLFEEIDRLKEEKNAVLLAHYYQESEIQDMADYIGDSLGLSRKAAETDAEIIMFAGVHFMAETAKIINPTKKVVMPDENAGCSLADSCPPEEFQEFVEAHPDHTVITYMNSTARIKALSDIICTSSNSTHIVEQLPEDEPIIFAPDKNLGKYVMRETGRDLLLWDGVCIVHEVFSEQRIARKQARYPNAAVLAHPECRESVLQHADFVGSTSKMRRFASESDYDTFIVATEEGLLHQMRKDNPNKEFIPAPPENGCNCSECPHMRLNTVEKIYLCLKHERPEVTLDEEIRREALEPIERMFEMSKGIK